MPAEILLDYLSRSSQWRRIQFQIVFQCAPVFKGVKASNIITLPEGTWKRLKGRIAGGEVRVMLLHGGGKNEVILFYREKWLHNILKKPEVESFFKTHGYTDLVLSAVLSRMQERYEAYVQGEMDFPHELGILLQYPLEDVKSFIVNAGKNSLFCGYWKVYHNPKEARKIFHLYDRIREKAAREFINDSMPEQIIC